MLSTGFDYEDKNFFLDLKNYALQQLQAEKNLLANISNLTSLIFHSMPDLNWCGFYLLEFNTGDLVLGPFQGKVACTRIKTSKGVCGAAFSQQRVICVEDVHSFPDHIACDSASKSELVIPFRFGKMGQQNFLEGVFDLDSPFYARFTTRDVEGLKSLVKEMEDFLR
jgi:L-methionine (R)-S-oxide reductase